MKKHINKEVYKEIKEGYTFNDFISKPFIDERGQLRFHNQLSFSDEDNTFIETLYEDQKVVVEAYNGVVERVITKKNLAFWIASYEVINVCKRIDEHTATTNEISNLPNMISSKIQGISAHCEELRNHYKFYFQKGMETLLKGANQCLSKQK